MNNISFEQYRYRRNFPNNNTIKEDPAEFLSKNNSVMTYTSIKPKINLNKKTGNNENLQIPFKKNIVRRMTTDAVRTSTISNEIINLKSEHLLRSISRNDKVEEEELKYKENNSKCSKQSSEGFFANNDNLQEVIRFLFIKKLLILTF